MKNESIYNDFVKAIETSIDYIVKNKTKNVFDQNNDLNIIYSIQGMVNNSPLIIVENGIELPEKNKQDIITLPFHSFTMADNNSVFSTLFTAPFKTLFTPEERNSFKLKQIIKRFRSEDDMLSMFNVIYREDKKSNYQQFIYNNMVMGIVKETGKIAWDSLNSVVFMLARDDYNNKKFKVSSAVKRSQMPEQFYTELLDTINEATSDTLNKLRLLNNQTKTVVKLPKRSRGNPKKMVREHDKPCFMVISPETYGTKCSDKELSDRTFELKPFKLMNLDMDWVKEPTITPAETWKSKNTDYVDIKFT